MSKSRFSQEFITEKRIAFAVNLANEIATEDHALSGFDCAERAVRKIFGRWLLDCTGTVPPSRMPLYLRLIDDVEQRLGVHRRRSQRPVPVDPAVACAPPLVSGSVRAVA